MDSFYGGRKGQDFAITPADKQNNKLAFENKVALEDDLKQRWQSPIGVGDYVLVSYGMASDEGYSEKLQKDLDKYKRSYNSTLWEKIYTENTWTGDSEVLFLSQKKGLGYRLVTSMTGNTPKFVSDVTVNPVSPDTPPTASIDSTNVDSPELILNLPKSQYMTVIKGDNVDSDDEPILIW
ncbi:MAG: hypothetical protein NC218_09295 [Acetobacter sp.]|nr:hypothetical protein [Acetobacter sp.]